MTIRRTITLISIVYAALLVVASLSLIVLTTRLFHLTNQVGQALESVHVMERLRTSLSNLSRETLIERLGATREQDARVAESRNRLLYWLAESYRFIGSQEERLLLDEARDSIQAYIATVERARGTTDRSSAAQAQERTRLFSTAQEHIRGLVELNMDQAREIQERAEFEDYVGSIVGVVIFMLIPPAMFILWLVMKRAILQPLSQLNNSIVRYSKGDQSRRIVVEGPEEVRKVADTLNSLADTVEHQRDAQLVFISSVAHDLRNPLGAIKMSIELLGDENADTDPEERRSLVDLVGRQVSNLDRMVGDLIDMTRVESGHLDLKRKPHDLRHLAQDAVTLHRAIAVRHELRLLTPNEPVVANCDSLRISQVMNNLLSNAIKYSPHGGTISVRVDSDREQGLITVSDEGIGIAEGDLYRIFEPFRRTKKTKATIPGVGLGLSVTKKIIEAHGGSIEVDSQVDRGTTFSVALPLALAERKKPSPAVTERHERDIEFT